jgi:hypothetical protein
LPLNYLPVIWVAILAHVAVSMKAAGGVGGTFGYGVPYRGGTRGD